jgi:hypothetical protein
VDEGNPPASGSSPGNLVDQLIPGGPAALQGRVEVGNPIADVMNSGPPLFEESGHRAGGIPRGQQLHLGFAEWQGNDGRAVGLLGRMRRETKNVAVKSERGVEVRHRYANVGNSGCLGHMSPGTKQDQR